MKHSIFHIAAKALTLALLPCAWGCTAVTEDEPQPCPQGLEVRFIYEYNLERANAFPAQVDCLTLHLYDSEGNFVRTLSETTEVLGDEEYRMIIDDLPVGDYRLVAYGGAICDDASITHTAVPDAGSKDTDLGMRLHDECLEPGNPLGMLHDHFYGSTYANVKVAPERTKVTVPMMKNTNTFRILLQNLNYEPLDGNDYHFEIEDDNTLFDHTNNLVDNGMVKYTPWDKGSIATGYVPIEYQAPAMRAPGEENPREVRLAYADMSTSRLMMKRTPVLRVYYKPTGKKIIELPLKEYLLALRDGRYAWAGDQEFLDRKSAWQLFFFLDDYQTWNKTRIKVDDWTVRINDINT